MRRAIYSVITRSSPRARFAAERRLADEYDAAQERGEIASGSVRTDIVPNENDVRPATAADLGLSRKDIHEVPNVR